MSDTHDALMNAARSAIETTTDNVHHRALLSTLITGAYHLGEVSAIVGAVAGLKATMTPAEVAPQGDAAELAVLKAVNACKQLAREHRDAGRAAAAAHVDKCIEAIYDATVPDPGD